MKSYLVIVLIFITLTQNLSAGWVLQVRYTNPEGKVSFEAIEIQNNRLRSAGIDGVFIFDLNDNTLAVVNEIDKTYWKYDINEIRQAYYDASRKFLDEIMKGFSESDRELYEMLFGDLENLYAPIDPEKLDSINVRIEPTGETEEFLGFVADEYLILVNEELKERKWLAKSLDINSQMNSRKMREIFMEISPAVGEEMLYQFTDAYLSLNEKGFEMRSLDNEGQETEVVSAEERNLDESIFSIPADYRRISIEEMMMTEFGKVEGEMKRE